MAFDKREFIIDQRNKGIADDDIFNALQTIEKEGEPKEKKGLIRKAGEFLGVEEFGKGLGRALFIGGGGVEELQAIESQGISIRNPAIKKILRTGTDEQKARIRKILGGISPIAKELEDIATGGLTSKQVIGSAVQTALGIGLAGTPVGKTLKAKVGIGVGIGSLFGGTESLKQDKGIVKGALVGAVTGGIVGGLTGALQKGIRSIVRKFPNRLIKSTLKQNKRDLMAQAKGKKPILEEQFLKSGLKGSEESIVEKSAAELTRLEINLQTTLDRNKNTFIKTNVLLRSLDNIVKRKRNVFGQKGVTAINAFKKVIESKGNRIALPEANRLKRDIYKELSDAAFNADVLPINKDILRTMASALKASIGDALPVSARINKKEQFFIRVMDSLEEQLQKQGRLNVFGLSDTVFASAGVASGNPLLGIGAGSVRRGFESTQFKTRAAIRLDQLGNLIDKIPTDTAGLISKEILFNELKKIQP